MARLPKISPLTAAAFLLLLVLGVYLRVHSPVPNAGIGFDEKFYWYYVQWVGHHGVGNYPALVQDYLSSQPRYPFGLPPPTRLTFILPASAWCWLTGSSALSAIQLATCVASILTLLAVTAFAARVKGPAFALVLLALFAFSPTQLYLAHRALSDSFVSLFVPLVLWSLWEVLTQSSQRSLWRAAYALSLFLLVLSKETALSPCLGLAAILLLNRWLRFGTVDRMLIFLTVLAPMAGLAALAICAGGWNFLLAACSLEANRALTADYSVTKQSGPWFGYLVEYLLVNPVVTLLAVGGVLGITKDERPGLFLLTFLAASYVAMCGVPHGINLRFAIYWDLPLTFLAVVLFFRWVQPLPPGSIRKLVLIVLAGVVVSSEIASYLTLFASQAVYDPVAGNLMQALKMISVQPQ